MQQPFSKRVFIITLAVVVASLGAFSFLNTPDSTAASHKEGEHMKPGFIHTVFFWVKEGTTEAQVQQLIDDCKTYLGAVETVQSLHVGKPAGTDREVVDNSYAVNLVVHFKDKAGHDHYQDAPKHHEFIERNKAIWQKVQVYDMLPE